MTSPHHTLMLTAACDEVVAATQAYHFLHEAGASYHVLRDAEARQAAAVHYINVLTRKMAEASPGAQHAAE